MYGHLLGPYELFTATDISLLVKSFSLDNAKVSISGLQAFQQVLRKLQPATQYHQ